MLAGMNLPELNELSELLRIESVSSDPAKRTDVVRAVEWFEAFVREAGGSVERAVTRRAPVSIGELRATRDAENAPTILCYGHVDVQPPGADELWDSPPFEPTVRDGRLYARGVADDKGQFWILLEAARQLHREGALPVNVRFLCDGGEESGDVSVVDVIEADERHADVCVIFDTAMLGRDMPLFNLALRGTVFYHLKVRTGGRDLHSGYFGGAALNALHVLHDVLGAVIPRDGRVRDELYAGTATPSEQELESWGKLRGGAEMLADQGARPCSPDAAREFYLRTWARPALDVHGIKSGEAELWKAIVPVEAEANLSIRLAPGQRADEIQPALERLLREATPEGAELELLLVGAGDPAMVPADAPPVVLGARAFERALGVAPLLVRNGGSLPILPALAKKGIPTIVTGFDLPDGNIHAPNEGMDLEQLRLGILTARELFTEYGKLP